MSKLPISYDEAIEYLKISPMFNLSLSSNELFHSNFLYWIWQSNPDAFKQIINGFTDNANWWRDNCEGKDIDVRREYKNFDLCIVEVVNNKILFVLENKVKSIPYAQQLIKYNAKIEEDNKKKNEGIPCYKLLLSLTDTFPDIEVDNEKSFEGWKLKSYSDYLLILSNLSLKDNFNVYLEDYRKYVENLIVCVEEWDRFPKLEDDKKPFGKYEYLEDAKELRLHALYYMYNTAKLCCMLINKLSDKLIGKKNVQVQYFGNEDDSIFLNNKKTDEYNNYFNDILVGVGYDFSNAKPILEVKVAKKTEITDERIFYIIQIQDKKYEHGIIEKCIRRELEGKIEKIDKYKNWVTNIPLCSASDIFSSGVLPENKSENKYNGYNATYSMVYKYRKLNEYASVENVLNQIVRDVEELITKKLTTNN